MRGTTLYKIAEGASTAHTGFGPTLNKKWLQDVWAHVWEFHNKSLAGLELAVYEDEWICVNCEEAL